MNKDKYVFAQLTEHLDYFRFRRLVRKYQGDSYVKHFSCWHQFLTLMFGQLSGRESLRDLVTVLEAHRSKCYHLGLGDRPVSRNAISLANQTRDFRIFEEFAFFHDGRGWQGVHDGGLQSGRQRVRLRFHDHSPVPLDFPLGKVPQAQGRREGPRSLRPGDTRPFFLPHHHRLRPRREGHVGHPV